MYLTLTHKEDLTPTVKSYSFEPEQPLAFKPGQFVMLKQVGAAAKFGRAFSIVGSPDSTHITFLMKHNLDGHVSGFLATAELGVHIETSVPIGRFVLDPTDTDRVFIATGTGFAPIASFLTTAPTVHVPHTTLFGVRTESDLFWTEKLPPDSLITLSQPSTQWSGLRGRVTVHMPELIVEHPSAAWYLCGNPDMVKEVRAQLIAAGTQTSAIHFEIY